MPEPIFEDEPMTRDAILGEIRAWLAHKLETGPVESRGHSDNSGHPHRWTAVLIPDWDMKQKIAMIDEELNQKWTPETARQRVGGTLGS